MTQDPGDGASTTSDARLTDRRPAGQVSFLDQVLWKQFNDAETPEAFARAWLALQCRLVSGATRGVVVLGEPDTGPYAPAAYWPDEEAKVPGLTAAAELAMAERRGIVQGAADDQPASTQSDCFLACPFLVDEQLYGVVAVAVEARPASQLRAVMRQLQWGASWIEVMVRRNTVQGDRDLLEQMMAALDLVATALDEDRFQTACNAVATELALRLDCDHVSIGFLRRGRVKVVALSHAAQFGKRMNLIRDIGAAMDEAVDQDAAILYPPGRDDDYVVTRAHGELARAHDSGPILTIPLSARGRCLGALTFERPREFEFTQATVDLCDCVGAVLGPILDSKRKNDRVIVWKVLDSIWTQTKRLLGPGNVGRKLAVLLILLAVGLFSVVRGDYRITAPANLEGLVQRVVVAPFDGYIASQAVRAGETIAVGGTMAALDDRDLTLERLRWSATRHQRRSELNRALALRDRAEINIIRAQIDQAEAQIDLLDEQISRSTLTAPYDALVVSGDLSQSIGVAVQRGQELFRLAPLDSYRVIVQVDEADIANVQVGQTGTLLMASLPGEPLPYTIERITPVSEPRDGRNYFRVEAELQSSSDRLRPGMEGIAKIQVDRRLLIWIWTHRMLDWVRLNVWRWWP